jgi:hypothetical protein
VRYSGALATLTDGGTRTLEEAYSILLDDPHDTPAFDRPAAVRRPRATDRREPSMARLCKAELLRITGGRLLAGLLVTAVALTALSIWGNSAAQLDAVDAGRTTMARASHELLRLGFGALLFATVFGALLTTSEFRHGSIARSLSFAAGRSD